jgi:hypothetical protein
MNLSIESRRADSQRVGQCRICRVNGSHLRIGGKHDAIGLSVKSAVNLPCVPHAPGIWGKIPSVIGNFARMQRALGVCVRQNADRRNPGWRCESATARPAACVKMLW